MAQPSRSEIIAFARQQAQKFGVDPNLVIAQMTQESGFKTGARNDSTATGQPSLGLMQLQPGTAKEMGVTNINDWKQNVVGGVKYLKQQLDTHGGDVDLALAAYNAGPGAVKKYGGIPPFKETQNYVTKIKANYAKLTGNATEQPQFPQGTPAEYAKALGDRTPRNVADARDRGALPALPPVADVRDARDRGAMPMPDLPNLGAPQPGMPTPAAPVRADVAPSSPPVAAPRPPVQLAAAPGAAPVPTPPAGAAPAGGPGPVAAAPFPPAQTAPQRLSLSDLIMGRAEAAEPTAPPLAAPVAPPRPPIAVAPAAGGAPVAPPAAPAPAPAPGVQNWAPMPQLGGGRAPNPMAAALTAPKPAAPVAPAAPPVAVPGAGAPPVPPQVEPRAFGVPFGPAIPAAAMATQPQAPSWFPPARVAPAAPTPGMPATPTPNPVAAALTQPKPAAPAPTAGVNFDARDFRAGNAPNAPMPTVPTPAAPSAAVAPRPGAAPTKLDPYTDEFAGPWTTPDVPVQRGPLHDEGQAIKKALSVGLVAANPGLAFSNAVVNSALPDQPSAPADAHPPEAPAPHAPDAHAPEAPPAPTVDAAPPTAAPPVPAAAPAAPAAPAGEQITVAPDGGGAGSGYIDPLEYAMRVQGLKRRQALAEQLMQQGMTPPPSITAPGAGQIPGLVVPTSPFLGLANLAGALMGAKQVKDIDSEMSQLAMQKKLSDVAVMSGQSPVMSGMGTPVARSIPGGAAPTAAGGAPAGAAPGAPAPSAAAPSGPMTQGSNSVDQVSNWLRQQAQIIATNTDMPYEKAYEMLSKDPRVAHALEMAKPTDRQRIAQDLQAGGTVGALAQADAAKTLQPEYRKYTDANGNITYEEYDPQRGAWVKSDGPQFGGAPTSAAAGGHGQPAQQPGMPSGNAKALDDQQAKSASGLEMMDTAHAALANAHPPGGVGERLAEMGDATGMGIKFTSEAERQRARDSSQWVMGVMRAGGDKVKNAANEDEKAVFARLLRDYTPQAGDTPGDLADKAKRREDMRRFLRAMPGPNYQPPQQAAPATGGHGAPAGGGRPSLDSFYGGGGGGGGHH